MRIYDISQEVFGCRVYEGDPSPRRETVFSMERGDLYNLTAFSMCAHNGTHVDAPAHFIADGKTVEQLPLHKTVGAAYVATHESTMTAEDAAAILERARHRGSADAYRRLLIKGDATVTPEAAAVFAEAGIDLLGVESQTVGPEDAPMATHLVLLGAGTVLLEGVRLSDVQEGEYLLCAAPLCLGGADGAPCRALLIEASAI